MRCFQSAQESSEEQARSAVGEIRRETAEAQNGGAARRVGSLVEIVRREEIHDGHGEAEHERKEQARVGNDERQPAESYATRRRNCPISATGIFQGDETFRQWRCDVAEEREAGSDEAERGLRQMDQPIILTADGEEKPDEAVVANRGREDK